MEEVSLYLKGGKQKYFAKRWGYKYNIAEINTKNNLGGNNITGGSHGEKN
jgi:hypothetical protein